MADPPSIESTWTHKSNDTRIMALCSRFGQPRPGDRVPGDRGCAINDVSSGLNSVARSLPGFGPRRPPPPSASARPAPQSAAISLSGLFPPTLLCPFWLLFLCPFGTNAPQKNPLHRPGSLFRGAGCTHYKSPPPPPPPPLKKRPENCLLSSIERPLSDYEY